MGDENDHQRNIKNRFRIHVPDHFAILQLLLEKTQVFLSYILTPIQAGVEL